MRIDRVVARAFGPFRGDRLELAPGMTVVYGPNEAGKSTWHAAIRLALNGVRRGKGRGTAAEAAVAERHRPWDSTTDDWRVEVRLGLDDGRIIEITQDLAGKVDCAALEVDLGRDVSNEILDGTPDASRWLGLDREAFAATLSVDQAQIVRVASSAEQLQEQMQRAAASRGTDATAAEAIERLVEFRREAVGVDKVGAKGPLRTAKERLARAGAARDVAHARHSDYLERGGQIEAAERRVMLARGALSRVQAAIAVAAADRAEQRAERASELSARHHHAPPPLAERDETADVVAAALGAWERRPSLPTLSGPTAADLVSELHALPAPPIGDRSPAAEVVAALHELDRAEEAMRAHDQRRDQAAAKPRRQPTAIVLVASFALLAAATLLSIGGIPFAGAMCAIAGLVLAGWALVGRRGSSERSRAALEDLRRQAAVALREALVARSTPDAATVREMWLAYQLACSQRGVEAVAAERGLTLEREIGSRRLAEEAAEDSRRAIRDIEASLRSAAQRAGIDPSGEATAVVERLRTWQQGSVASRRAGEIALAEWRELTELLNGATPLALAREATRLSGAARAAVEQLEANVEPIPAGIQLDRLLDDRREAVAAADREWHELKGALEGMGIDLPSVAEAEEEVTAAETELSRVEGLATAIDETLRLLREAQDRVHRDLAPILASAVRRWLPLVSGGAYLDVTVDPATLAIRVKEARTGAWRTAALLSEGTREQIYLLLRIGMAEHLVTTGETAPLLLDEVTAQADAHRRLAVLTVLQQVSTERQVILFTHDAEVAAWASEHLDRDRDRLVTLAAVTSPPPGARIAVLGTLPTAFEREEAAQPV